MSPLPVAEWTAALSVMHDGVAAVLAEFDRTAPARDIVLTDPAPADGLATPLERLEARLRDWDARLTAATELAAEVEREIAEREEAVARWRQTFERWREVIQQPAD